MKALSMTDVFTLCTSLGIEPQAGPDGVRIGTTGWRLERGGGVAGHADEWWLRPIAGAYHPDAPDAKAAPRGPARTREELLALLRAKWRRLPTENA